MAGDPRGTEVWQRFTADMGRYVGNGRKQWSPGYLRDVLCQAHAHPGLLAIAVYRFGQWVVYRVRIPVIRQLLLLVYYVMYNAVRVGLNTELPYSATIGGGLRLLHFGCLIHGGLIAGEGLSVNRGVTVGASETGVPRLGNNVRLTVDVKVFGGIVLGDNVVAGAGAVVNKSFPDNVIIAGVPAKIIGSVNGSEPFEEN